MKHLKITEHVGKDGILRLQVPVDVAEQDLEVVIVMQPLTHASTPPSTDSWPNGFFEATAGVLADAPLRRSAQGDFEVRPELS
ncbi:MAG: hypothetical protein HY718_02875 [Planctomycetes bacterium]|nr:hypothetical protein [Planctomycetota bacterium]